MKKKLYSEQDDDNYSPLKMNKMLWGLVTGLNMALTYKLMCKQFFEVKVQEFFILLRVFYTKDQLRNFFYYVLSPDTVFSEFVKSNWLICSMVEGLSGAINLSVRHFTKKFKAIFGMPPGEWILQKKSQCVLEDLQGGCKTYQQIAADYGSASILISIAFAKLDLMRLQMKSGTIHARLSFRGVCPILKTGEG